jgi:predicted  nucleic acid-binding Zn-ribbon protein
MGDELKRLVERAAALEEQARELREAIEELAASGADAQLAVEAAESEAPDDSEARIVAFSMVLDGRPREEVARHLADELGIVDSEALLDDLYARAG